MTLDDLEGRYALLRLKFI